MSSHHYIITVQSPDRGGYKIGTYAGVVFLPPNPSRQEVFVSRFNYACTQLGSDPTNTYVLFWSLERDDME